MSETSDPRDSRRHAGAVPDPPQQAGADLLPALYEELRVAAERQLARESPGLTLQPTALVHEAYLRIVGSADPGWSGRAHFFASAAQAMRRILVERARRNGSGPRRTESDPQPAADRTAANGASDVDLIALDDALTRLAVTQPRRARVVEFLYFAGLSQEETAVLLEVSTSTVKSEWRLARSWLYRELSRGGGP